MTITQNSFDEEDPFSSRRCEIPVSEPPWGGQVSDEFYRGYAIVDDDLEELKNYAWKSGPNGKYALLDWRNTTPLGIEDLKKKGYSKGAEIWMHRFIVKCPPGMEVDHANWDTLDNRRSNLRICTTFQNKCNRRISYKDKRNGSRYRGVSFLGFFKGFKAQIEVDEGEFEELGIYTAERGAVEAYNKAATSYHKEFAVLNEYNTEDDSRKFEAFGGAVILSVILYLILGIFSLIFLPILIYGIFFHAPD